MTFTTTVDDGKYTVEYDQGKLRALRYGEFWQDLTGNNLVYYLAAELNEAREELAKQKCIGTVQLPLKEIVEALDVAQALTEKSYHHPKILQAYKDANAALKSSTEAHADDLAVDRFAAVMKVKLAEKRAEGRGGWEDYDQCTAEFLSSLLREHVSKGDPIDVANLSMMLHQRGQRITAAPVMTREQELACRETTCNAVVEQYFSCGFQPPNTRNVFRDGFERGWDAARLNWGEPENE